VWTPIRTRTSTPSGQRWEASDRCALVAAASASLALEMAREGVPLVVIQRQLGHSNLGITSVYLQGIDNAEIIETVDARRAPMVPVTTSRPDLPGTSH
jgi:integrase